MDTLRSARSSIHENRMRVLARRKRRMQRPPPAYLSQAARRCLRPVVFALMAGAALPAWSACRMAMPVVVRLAPEGYRPFDDGTLVVAVRALVEGDATCRYAFGATGAVADQHPLDGPGGTLPLTLSLSPSTARPLRDLPLAPLADLLTGSTAAAGSAALDFWAMLPGGLKRAPGEYAATVRFTLYALRQSATAEYIPAQMQDVRFLLAMPAYTRAQLVLDGVASAFGAPRRLDFGELTSGAWREFTVSVESNVRYTLSLASRNIQQLVCTAPNRLAKIPYTVQAIRAQSGPLGGSTTFRIEIGATGNAPACDYADSIELTITAL